jgi:phage-related protein (TIGR01555 family)
MDEKEKIENEVEQTKTNAEKIYNEAIANGLSEAVLGFNFATEGVQLSQIDTLFKNNRWYLVSNMRQIISELYVEHGVVTTAVDVPVEDAFRNGVDVVTNQLDEEEIRQLKTHLVDDLQVYVQAQKWNRLFGGAGVIMITGQDPEEELDINSVAKGDKIRFRAVDMWELFHTRNQTEDLNTQLQQIEYSHYNYYQQKLHRSHVIKLIGKQPPSLVRPRLRGWGMSVLEVMIRSINQYLKANEVIFEVIDEFKVDIFKIKGLASSLIQADGDAKVRRRIQIANAEKNFQNAMTLDSEDDWGQKELAFAGISETLTGIKQHLASDLRMPLTKLFGVSAAGFNSGEDDIENYNAMVESSIRTPAKKDLILMIKVRCQQLFGYVPDDLDIEFTPLRVLSSEQEENVKTSKFSRLLQARQAGEISRLEFRQGINRDDLLPIQLDEEGIEDDLGKPEENKVSAKQATAPQSTMSAPLAKNESDLKKKVAVVGIIHEGEILTGQRRDNNKWTFPGGHFEEGESAEEAVYREALEECGISLNPGKLEALSKITNEDGTEVFPFIAYLDERQYPNTIKDPDSEFQIIKWVPLAKETTELMPESRHVPNDAIVNYFFGTIKNTRPFDDMAFEASGGDGQFSIWRKRLFLWPPDRYNKTKWEIAKEYGGNHWQKVLWKYKQLGGKL